MSTNALRAAASAIGLGFALLVFAVLGYIAGPQVEGLILPPVTATFLAGSVERNDKEICWGTHYEKHRNLEPSYFNYRIRYRGDRIPIGAYRVEDGRRVYLSTYGFSNHPKGAVWDSRYCADMPRDIDLSHSFIVEAEGFYAGLLWEVPQRLPSFEVQAR